VKRIDTILMVDVTVVDHGVHGIRVIMGDKVKREIGDMLDDDQIEALTQEIAESEDPLGIDVDADEDPNEEGER
jgi:hypothetical protein